MAEKAGMTRGIARFASVAAAAAVLVAASARAQSPALPPHPFTMLQLTAQATVARVPDRLTARLAAQATAANPAAAQRSVNQQTAEATQAAHDAAGITLRTLGYNVRPADSPRKQWVAEQELELATNDAAQAPALLDLVGQLQGRGLAVSDLAWSLSPAAQRDAEAAATGAALQDLQQRAAAAAAALGMHVDRFVTVRLNQGLHPPGPLMARAAVAMAAPPPEATQSPQEVTITVFGEAALAPGK
jgi:predicted secreted protein